MRNIISRLLGESNSVVPVIANMPRQEFLRRKRQRAGTDAKPEPGDDSVRRMVGEAQDKEREGVIPKEAEPVDPGEVTDGKPIPTPKEVVQEPSHPQADKEKYLTPYSALTAPDVTPQSTEPIDPSEVPGAAGPQRFTAADLERATETPTAAPKADMASQAMNVLLGQNRASKPPTQPGEFERAGAVATEEQAAALMGIESPLMEGASSRAAAAMVAAKDGGSGMPDPTPSSDGSRIYSAFRRFSG